MPWKPSTPGERPTLGGYVIEWCYDNLIVPDGPLAGEPLTFTGEQEDFILRFYEVDPLFDGVPIRGAALVNARLVRRAMLSRPKGWGKSPVCAALALCEGLGDVVLDGWDAAGQPVGRPWRSLGFKPKVQIVAVSEDQTINTWDPLLEMAKNGPVADNYAINPMQTFCVIPSGRIEYTTSAASSREGFRPVFAHFDQTESWSPTNGGTKLAATVRRNIAKVNGSSVETPNAFVPGENSVAEKTWEAYAKQREGKTRGKDTGIFVDHREAPAETDPSNRESLKAGLAFAYGESGDAQGGWVNLDRIIEDYWDPNTDPQDARHFYLNQVTHATNSWITQPQWAGCLRRYQLEDGSSDEDAVVLDGDVVVLGFDGSRQRASGVADATALIGCRVRDGHVFQVRVWEQPEGPDGDGWQVPRVEVEAEVAACFDRWQVVGFYADPAKWEEHVASWEARYGERLIVKATRDHPVEWWMTGGRSTLIVRATAACEQAIKGKQLTHDGAATLTRHVLNARRKNTPSGIQLSKEHAESERKIDAAVAMVLAWQCRLDAIAEGALDKIGKRRSKVVHRW